MVMVVVGTCTKTHLQAIYQVNTLVIQQLAIIARKLSAQWLKKWWKESATAPIKGVREAK